ncbi:two-component system sensor histidine kinase AtoS [Bacillaceae bacterium Marseille-Q3522]|nr:two-component system sensor histidine kinase AtoS [Bacillaceae bacterium Marseille-Q3522]
MHFLRPKSFHKRVAILLVLTVSIPIILSGYFLKLTAENGLLDEKQDKLFTLTEMLDKHLQSGYEHILRKNGVEDADRETQINVLNRELKSMTDFVASAQSGVGVGYYSKELDAMITYGPSKEYSEMVGEPISTEHPGRKVMQTGIKDFQIGDQARGNIANAMMPLKRNGKVIGYVWANELTNNVDNQLTVMDKNIYFTLIIVIGFISFFLYWVSKWLTKDMNIILHSIKKMQTNLSTRITGLKADEMKHIGNALNEMASSLQHARSMTENIMESIADGVITTNTRGCIRSLNKAALEMTGFTIEKVIGQPYKKLFLSGHHVYSLLMDTLHTGKKHIGFETEFQVKGKEMKVSISTAQLCTANGEIIGAVAVFTDITEKKRLEDQLKRADRMAAMGEMMAGIAHEIRNPLTGIKGFIQYLQSSSTEEEKQLYMPVIIKEVDRVNQIIEELLYFSRPSEAKYSKININDELKQIILLAKNSAGKRIKFVMLFDDKLPYVEADSSLLKQGFLNILLNSIQAISSEGTITVKTAIEEKDNQYVSIQFIDTGSGINKKDLEHVFDPFFTTKKSGTGLGLAVTQRIIAAHNGYIYFETYRKGCTVVHLSLPIKQWKGGNAVGK